MKKLSLMLSFLTICFSSAYISNAQTISSLIIHDSCTYVHATTVLSAAGTNLSVTTFWGDGSSRTTALQNTQKTAGFNKGYATSGTYTITTVLYKNGNPIDSATRIFGSYCSYIKIRTYMDNNNNCVIDQGEGILRAQISVEVDSAGVKVDTLLCRGRGWYRAKAGVVYKFKTLNSAPGVTLACPSNGVITITAQQGSQNANFGYNCSNSSAFDLSVNLFGRFRPVNTSRLIVHVYNNACGPKNGVLTVHLSNKYTYKSANPTPTSVNGNVLTWNITGLSALASKNIYIQADTATKVNINDTVCNYAIITPTSGDVVPANNTITKCDKVRASWDPNDKGVHPSGDIMPGTKLTYTVNFENLGNDTAFNIHILDTLSDHVDVNSFEILHSSHDVSYFFVQNSINKNILRFEFVDIHLPDSSSTDNKGFVTFSINAKQGLQPLTQINNQAAIYFDINPPIITNIAENRIAPVGISSINVTEDVRVYPNPVTDVLTIQTEASTYNSLKLYNNIGQVLMQQNVNSNTTQIDMKHLPTGMYYIQLQGDAGTTTKKIEKL